jgi:hypothetical protein
MATRYTMKIIYLNGGLANQTFQYIFYRFCELKYPEYGPWFLDDSFFYTNKAHNGYELDKVFGVSPNLLSQYFDEDVWDEFIRNKRNGHSIPKTMRDMGFDVTFIAEYHGSGKLNPYDGPVYQLPENAFLVPFVPPNSPITYFHVYALDINYFNAYRDILKEELSFPPIDDPMNLEYAHSLLSRYSVAVHIRRGDFVPINAAMECEYYHNAITGILQDTPDCHFFVFSDDLGWCRDNRDELGLSLTPHITYVSGNTGPNSFRDLQLMTLSREMILCVSSFGYLALVLSETILKAVNPTHRPI